MFGEQQIEEEFAAFVNSSSFSCLVGKGVVHQRGHIVRAYPPLGTRAATRALADDLARFGDGASAAGAETGGGCESCARAGTAITDGRRRHR